VIFICQLIGFGKKEKEKAKIDDSGGILPCIGYIVVVLSFA
jgi:hypothetical protein